MENNPIITGYVKDVNANTIALTGNSEILVRYYSNAEVLMDVSSPSGAPLDLDTYIIRNGNSTVFGLAGTFNNVESNQFYFSAADAYGNIGTLQKGVPFVEYQKLTCHIGNSRPDASGAMTLVCTGSFFNGSFGAVSNTLVVNYRYQEIGGTASGWGAMTVSVNGNSYSAYANVTGLNYQSVYNFEVLATDCLDTVQTSTAGVRSVPVFHWGESDFAFEVPVSVKNDLNVTGNMRLKGSGNYGNYLRLGDSDFCYIAEKTDDIMTIHASALDIETGTLSMNGSLIASGTWTPTLSAMVSSFTARNGWYYKFGKTVIVGFYIKATMSYLSSRVDVQISGLPFTPLYSAPGGGLCSQAMVAAGCNFQCFVAEPSGVITTRVQACNNTAEATLATSASGCYYPIGGGEITLGGTITYMTND